MERTWLGSLKPILSSVEKTKSVAHNNSSAANSLRSLDSRTQPLTGIFMRKLYVKFVVTHFVLSAIMFCVWYLVAGIENAREMTFVISTLASCVAAKNLMDDTLKEKTLTSNKS
jgi:hypothetical protein